MKFTPASLNLTMEEVNILCSARNILEYIATATSESLDYENIHYAADRSEMYLSDLINEYNDTLEKDE